ncbi:MAG TPA: ABC transporter permease [Thermoanaerobaculia bacterium]|nr:ABC transporter permease [Thermoanaerobaculia bacterium]
MHLPLTLRHVLRKLRQAPTFTAVAIGTLALGIGANSAIFSVVDAVLLQPLSYEEPERLVYVDHAAPGIDIPQVGFTDALYLTYSELAETFDALGLYRDDTVNLTGLDRPERLDAAQVTGSLFRVLRVDAALGRALTDADGAPGAAPVLVLSEGLWHARFGGDPGVVGRTVRVDGEERTVVGVMPAGFDFPRGAVRLWLPLPLDPADTNNGSFSYSAIGRLRPGVDPAAARAELDRLLPRMLELYPGDMTATMLETARLGAAVRPLRDELVGDVEGALWILFGAVGLILLIACANVANLFLARAEGRGREMAVRAALGAGRRDLLATFLVESTVLALAGGVVGLGLAVAGVRALIAFGPEAVPRIEQVGVNGSVLLFTLAVSLVAGVLFGAVPMLRHGRRRDLTVSLRDGGRGATTGRDRQLARNGLVVAQVALALVLLVGAGLLLRSFRALSDVDPGFRPEGVLTLRVALDEADYPDGVAVAGFYHRLLDRLAALPGVESAAAASSLPLSGQNSNNGHLVEGWPVPPGDLPPILASGFVSPSYFRTLGVPVVAGRELERADSEERRQVVVVSRALAERFWPNQDPLGKRLQPGIGQDQGDEYWYTVVGVVGDVRHRGFAEAVEPMVYYPLAPPTTEDRTDYYTRSLSLVLRSRGGDPLALADAARHAVHAADPNLPVASIQTMERMVADSVASIRFTMVLLLIAGAVALLLGTVGLYGVLSYLVSLRTQEIGVRMAMGADGGDVSRLVVGQALTVSAVGVVLGLATALLLSRLMATLLFGVAPHDPATYTAVTALLLATASLVSWRPARQAASVDPMVALRGE